MKGGGVDTGVGEAAAVEFAQDEQFDVLRGEGVEHGGVGDAAAQVLIDREGELGEESGLGKEDDGVVAWGVFEQEAHFAQVLGWHEVGIVDGKGDGFALAVEGVGLFDELFFALEVAALVVDGENVAYHPG